MSKFTYLVLCVVAVSSRTANALSDEEKAAVRASIIPFVEECSKQHDVSAAVLKSAKEAGSADTLKPCFLGCVLKKIGIFNDDGFYNVEKGFSIAKEFVKDPAEQAKFEDIGKQCAVVNEKSVTDGAAGCDRALLLVACAFEHNAEIPL